ncbi:hypothetical protein F4827_001715 [Paraburkholderia bannensis]|uniref:Tyr recombinase domain-containing protein n=1 Tax=Paraburkholderia bannensis TaxID=765414 RepID=A0A7W9TUV6_9BURK|nr:tyrosine-type recombinase/integrase [Paraburkholderia bannensis]MBB6101867.1 hypothetical protein [Paraburkholderia bannensis]
MAEIARDRADAVTRLARTNARRCVAPSPNLMADRTAAAARLDALDVERDEARRAEAAQDRAAAERAAALADPVTGALTAFGVTAPRAELVTGLAFAGVLEAVACFAWLLALRPKVVTESPVMPAQQGSNASVTAAVMPESHAAPVLTVTPADAPASILCLVDLCYLTVQRSTEIRALRWKKEGTAANWIDRDNGVIHFMPSKTQDSSGIAVDWPITPEIDAVLEIARGLGKIKGPHVIHKATGAAWKASDALKVWRDACNRAKLQEFGYTIKDIRAKAITDARRAGYDIDALQVAAAHADKATTEIYFKDRTVPVSNVRLAIPKSA